MTKSCLGMEVVVIALWLCGPCVAQQATPAPEDLYRVALSCMQKADYAKVKAALAMLVLEYPNDERQGMAHLLLSQVYLQENDFFAAKLTLEQTVEKFADSKDSKGKLVLPTALTYLGALYASMKREEDAKRVYGRLQKEFPDAMDDEGQKLVSSIPEQYRTGAAGPGAPSSPPTAGQPPAALDKAAKQKIYRELVRMIDRAKDEATKLYPRGLNDRKDYIKKKTDAARKATMAKYKISAMELDGIVESGEKSGW